MSNTSIITCNIGSLDEIYPPEKQGVDYEYYYYHENNLPFPLPDLNNRMKGKYLKTQTHRFLGNDIFIWIDGSVEIIHEDFVKACIDALQDCDIVTTLHTQRTSVYQELEYIIDRMKEGDKYLLKRYARAPFYLEYEFYKKQGLPKTFPLYGCYFFARRNNSFVNKVFDQWWEMILRYSNFDQSQFSFIAWKNKVKINTIEVEKYLVRHKHE